MRGVINLATYDAGIVTAYGAAVRGGYTGTYEDFCAQQANYASTAAAVAQAKTDAEAAATAAQTAAASLTVDSAMSNSSTNPVQNKVIYGELSDLKDGLSDMDDRVTALEDYGGGISMTAVNLLDTILSEAVYGTDQTANIALLKNELSKIPPVSISAVLDGTALEGQNYSELDFIVTATFDDESTVVVDDYTLVTTGTVVAGSNTVTIRYRGVTTTCTFTAEAVITYNITYNLSNVTSSNTTTVVVEDSYYSTVLSIPDDYGLDGCTVTMGGVDVTSSVYSNMEILITQVTGDVVITASATEIVPITDVAHYGITTRVYSYSDDGQTSINNNNYGSELYYTKHNFAKASKVTVTVTNNTDNDIKVSVYAGEIPANVGIFAGVSNQYKPTRTNIELWNAVKVTPSSNVIPAGGSISADVNITAGRRIAVSLPQNTTSLDITMVGAYDPIDYSADYDLLALTALGGATTTGRTYYTDAGTTVVENNGTNVWGYEYYNSAYQWDSSKLYNIVVRYEPLNDTDTFSSHFIGGFGTEVRTTTVYNCNSLCDSNHWKGKQNYLIPFFDYIGTIQPLSGYPVYTTFNYNDKCKIYVKEANA